MADSPKATETAQALFCAIVDKRGAKFKLDKKNKPIPPDYEDFKKKNLKEMTAIFNDSKLDAPGVSFDMVDKLLLNDNSWYESSVFIANRVYDVIDKFAGEKLKQKIKSKGLDLFYARGDKAVMDSITTIFKKVKQLAEKRNNDKYRDGVKPLLPGDLNKWSPADIYYATDFARKSLTDVSGTSEKSHLNTPIKIGKSLKITGVASMRQFEIFNAYIKYLIDSGDLLPLSLKKTGNMNETIVKSLNYEEGDVEKYFKEKDIGFKKFDFSKGSDKFFDSFDIKINVSDKHKLQFRDKGSSGESKGKGPSFSYQCVIVGGAEALDGSFGGESLPNIMSSTPGCVELSKKFSLQIQSNLAADGYKLGQELVKMAKSAKTVKAYDKVFIDWYKKHKNNSQVKEYLMYAKDLGSVKELEANHFKMMVNHKSFVKLSDQKKARRIGQFLYAKMLGGRLITEMKKLSTERRDLLVINMLRYAGSRAELSGPHVKAGSVTSF